MKTKISILLLLLSFVGFSQSTTVVRGIFTNKNTGTAMVSGASLDLSGTNNQGAILPRGTTTNRNTITVGAAQNGMLYFNTTTNLYEFYDHPTTSWKVVGGSGSVPTIDQVLGSGDTADDKTLRMNGSGGQYILLGGDDAFDMYDTSGNELFWITRDAISGGEEAVIYWFDPATGNSHGLAGSGISASNRLPAASGTLAVSVNGTAADAAGNITISTGGTIDPTPTDGSTNAVQSNGVFDALATKEPVQSGTGFVRSASGTKTYIGETGSGNVVLATSPTLVTPNLGTPSAAVLTNATGLPLTTGVTATLGLGNGGTGISNLGGSRVTSISLRNLFLLSSAIGTIPKSVLTVRTSTFLRHIRRESCTSTILLIWRVVRMPNLKKNSRIIA